MLLRGLTLLILMQLLGTALNVLLLPMIPGQVLGMLLLFVLLILRGEVSPPLQEAASSLLRYLPLLLIPIAVSSVLYIDTLSGQLFAVGAAMLLSLVISLLFTGWLMEKLIARQKHQEDQA
jgi:putative effector of murein hydrolase LrgA (UPF0299 family)